MSLEDIASLLTPTNDDLLFLALCFLFVNLLQDKDLEWVYGLGFGSLSELAESFGLPTEEQAEESD